MEIAADIPGSSKSIHSFRLDIFDGSGKRNPSYSRIVHSSGGKAVCTFALPLNKGTGKWKAVITELLTGVQNSVSF